MHSNGGLWMGSSDDLANEDLAHLPTWAPILLQIAIRALEKRDMAASSRPTRLISTGREEARTA